MHIPELTCPGSASIFEPYPRPAPALAQTIHPPYTHCDADYTSIYIYTKGVRKHINNSVIGICTQTGKQKVNKVQQQTYTHRL